MNKSFSERMGYASVRLELQVNGMDIRLKNRLWNACELFIEKDLNRNEEIILLKDLWDSLFGLNISELEAFKIKEGVIEYYSSKHMRKDINKRVINDKWYVMYDFIESLLEFAKEKETTLFSSSIDKVLEQENSGYRIVNDLVTPITSQQEINEVEEAAQSPYKSVNEHLKTAIQLFSDRENPDYRNSMKEAISAVESLCCIVAEDEDATLGKALAKIEKKLNLDGGFKKAINALYGYTSNEGGIRHKLFEGSQEIKFEDAKFMLVSCSAFINYLIAKNV